LTFKTIAVALIQRTGKVLGVDVGENNLATTSEGKIFKGYQLRHERDKYLALIRRLLSNGSPSAMQRLKGISGREAFRVKHENHVISKQIVESAVALGCDTIAMEDLTNIRKRIKAGKRVRFRLHGWPWAQLQTFIEYKARAKGINVVYVNPAYTSKTCAECGAIGNRSKHRFTCKFCGIQRHADLNASHNIRRIAMSADVATGTVDYPHV
jgi:putative transposase